MDYILKNSNRLIINGKYPGTGKTHAYLRLPNCLFVFPCRTLVNKYKRMGLQSTTMDNFLGMNFLDENSKRKSYDLTGIQNVVFDEINCHSIYKLNKLKLF